MKFLPVAVITLLSLSSSGIVSGQELCLSAIEIPSSDFNSRIFGSTINKTSTTEGCGQNGQNLSKQWYKFEMNAYLRGYYSWLTCTTATSDDDTESISNAIQQRCDEEVCHGERGDAVDPDDLIIEECSDAASQSSYSMLWTGINNLTFNSYVAYGQDENNTTGDFVTTLIQHTPPPNHFCDDAIPLVRNGPSVEGSLYNAMPYLFSLPGSTPVCGNEAKVSVWYSFVGHGVYKAVIRTCPTDYDDNPSWSHTIDVVENCGDTRCACVTCQVVTNPDCANGAGKQLTLTTQGAKTYRVAVSINSVTHRRGTFEIQVLTENTITETPTSVPTQVAVPTPSPEATPAPVPPPTQPPVTAPPTSSSSGDYIPRNFGVLIVAVTCMVAIFSTCLL